MSKFSLGSIAITSGTATLKYPDGRIPTDMRLSVLEGVETVRGDRHIKAGEEVIETYPATGHITIEKGGRYNGPVGAGAKFTCVGPEGTSNMLIPPVVVAGKVYSSNFLLGNSVIFEEPQDKINLVTDRGDLEPLGADAVGAPPADLA